MKKHVHLIIVTDCGGSDQLRYEIAAQRSFYPHDLRISFYATDSMNTMHAGFVAAAHVLSAIDHFGRLREEERIGLLVNAAPRENSDDIQFRGEGRDRGGEEIYALHLRNGVWVVGPNAGFNLFFLKDMVHTSFLLVDDSGQETPFRSMEVMVPALAKILVNWQAFPYLRFELKWLPPMYADAGLFVADYDSHGNMYLVSTMPNDDWVPAMGESRIFHINGKRLRLLHSDGIFSGITGEPVLTTGSLKLNNEPIYYIVIVGGNASAAFGNPAPGTKVEIE